ncbi:protein translocase subunit SecD [Rhodococcus sp. BP-149]|uniref:protein translocase subunit SecD n=1 Tax=unclassified Rhodococcus (in: high G+C Gram-positive bacteria) TaxID=192944 RepID=UPI001C9AAB1D|nr:MULTISPECIES: protein translocase subunit SecD [unclassified Rhodococcus (in: high G+C Gram-positive bacteria)]MBY6687087.1 protein translocase subunit SecD [Rhodococcus sp. BP-288]MBY6693860.1 protein translocase subunit SecD [Rhodococcus sp. BP-188]MBY6699199.1 protein translocase subunit SecD [Rhodococcus sp. BP-285]MBY6702807.1 protein translocase subunit SecD [Rhodococcus sp. BP-283]MBY6711613.1 protein translocase subunit SecD [Rhodococcus sp. BP-160]
MAPSSGSSYPVRYLAVFGVFIALVYVLVFFTGDKSPTPKLGIDLQGGTRVTLTARTPDGSAPSQESLRQAQQIIETRVNGLGVSGSEVVVDGQNLVITVPGDDSSQARTLGQTARLYIRPVLTSQAPTPAGTPAPAATDPAADPAAADPAATTAPATPAPQNRPFPAQDPTDTPAPSETSAPSETPAPSDTSASEPGAAPPASSADETADAIAEAKAQRQSTDPTVQQQAMATIDCSAPDPLQGNDDPALPLVACSTDGTAVYILEPSIIDGQQIADASSQFDTQQSRNVVSLSFTTEGGNTWAQFTSANIGKQAAFTLDSKVVSAPVIQGATPAGSATQITGNFTADSARELANTLKYGSLPLSFAASEAETVSATLGLASLEAGLIAGAIGLVFVLIYCLLYYRMLGILTALSLVLSLVAIYGILVLLGRWISFTLDLAGIAGLIIGIGMTADSFVVFFERIKDEIREGRSFRSAVPRGWARARRTILSGNAVSFIAAAVLYVLAVGQVRGFAFTLGLSTLLDIVIVILVTWPLVNLASRSEFWSKPSINGLGAVQEIARARKRAAAAKTTRDAATAAAGPSKEA